MPEIDIKQRLNKVKKLIRLLTKIKNEVKYITKYIRSIYMESRNFKLKAYKYIKEKIISGEFYPNQKLEEIVIAQKLKISRTPVREAVNALKEEDWLNIIPRKGIFVKEITLKDINDIFRVREVIEPIILKLPFRNLEKEKIEEFIRIFESYRDSSTEIDNINLDKYDNKLHYYLLESSNNKYFINLMNNVYEHNQRLRNISSQEDSRRLSATEEHLRILYAIRDREKELAIKSLSEHIENSKINFLLSIGSLNLVG